MLQIDRATVGECVTTRSLRSEECGPEEELQGLSPHTVGRPNQLETREIRVGLETKGERE